MATTDLTTLFDHGDDSCCNQESRVQAKETLMLSSCETDCNVDLQANKPPKSHDVCEDLEAGPVNTTTSAHTPTVDAQREADCISWLSFACRDGDADLVRRLLPHANIDHRKLRFTLLKLAVTGGHKEIITILLQHGADIEVQCESTKNSPLSLACFCGRFEIVELLLAHGANKEHHNACDYSPLSIAAAGDDINIIKLLLNHGAEINSRTGSITGISPLILAAMHGRTAAVCLLLSMGSDINAQMKSFHHTALTIACFKGHQEVVSLLVDHKANIEHRDKTGLTPLMMAASGGYVEVGKVLLDKGADIAAPPVPSSRETALTIAADKGHVQFVKLLIDRGAAIDVKNKKGNSPLWLACNGGHLEVVQLLVNAGANVNSQDNKKVSCLMIAFRKGHVELIEWLVRHIEQFPTYQECTRYIRDVTDEEQIKKCLQCLELIFSAKKLRLTIKGAEAKKNEEILLKELDRERSHEELKRAAAARKREKKKQKKDKQSGKDETGGRKGDDDDDDDSSDERIEMPAVKIGQDTKQNGDEKDGTTVDKIISIRVTSGSKEIKQVDEDDKKTKEGKMPKSSKPIQDRAVNDMREETMDDSVKASDTTESNNGAWKRGGALRRGQKSSRATAQESLAAQAQKEEKLQTLAVVLDVSLSNQRSLNAAAVCSSKGTSVAPLSKMTAAKDSSERSTKIMPLIQPGALSSVTPNFASSMGIGDFDGFGTILPNVHIPPLMVEHLRNGVTVPSDRNEEKAVRASRSSGLVNYDTKNPMTLSHIDSNINPNAQNLTTKAVLGGGGGAGGLICLTQPAANSDTPSSSNPASPSPSSSGDLASRAIRPIGVERLIKKPSVIAGRVQESVGYNNYMANPSDVDMLHQQQDAWSYGSAAHYTTVEGGGDWVMPSMVPPTMSIPPLPIGPCGDEFGTPPSPQKVGHMPQPTLQQHPSLTSHLEYTSFAQTTVHPSAAMFDQHPLSYDPSMMESKSIRLKTDETQALLQDLRSNMDLVSWFIKCITASSTVGAPCTVIINAFRVENEKIIGQLSSVSEKKDAIMENLWKSLTDKDAANKSLKPQVDSLLGFAALFQARSSMMHAPPLLTNGGGMADNTGGMSMPPPPHGPRPDFPPPINISRSLCGQPQFDNMSWGVTQMNGMPPLPPPDNANM